MNKLLIGLIATGALSIAPLSFAQTDVNNTQPLAPSETSSPQGTPLTLDKENESKKHLEVNLKSNGQEFPAIIPQKNAKDLNKGDTLEVGDDEHKTSEQPLP